MLGAPEVERKNPLCTATGPQVEAEENICQAFQFCPSKLERKRQNSVWLGS
jgi:hypothetical protein